MGDHGVVVGPQGRVEGIHSASNGHDGILATSGSLVVRSTLFANIGYGLSMNGLGGYLENVIQSNVQGTVSLGNNMGGNVCDGTLICP